MIKHSDQHLRVLLLEQRWDLLFLLEAEDRARGEAPRSMCVGRQQGEWGLQCTPCF